MRVLSAREIGEVLPKLARIEARWRELATTVSPNSLQEPYRLDEQLRLTRLEAAFGEIDAIEAMIAPYRAPDVDRGEELDALIERIDAFRQKHYETIGVESGSRTDNVQPVALSCPAASRARG